MAIIKSGASTDQLSVDATSKAARVTIYDVRGNAAVQKATYSAGLTFTATAAGTGIFFNIIGSASKTVRVQRISFWATCATAAVAVPALVSKRTAATTGGTATTLTGVAHDSGSAAATAVPKFFTVLATAGTGGGTLTAQQVSIPLTAAAAIPTNILFDRTSVQEAEGWVLRGVAECLEVNFGVTTTNAPSMTCEVRWTEE